MKESSKNRTEYQKFLYSLFVKYGIESPDESWSNSVWKVIVNNRLSDFDLQNFYKELSEFNIKNPSDENWTHVSHDELEAAERFSVEDIKKAADRKKIADAKNMKKTADRKKIADAKKVKDMNKVLERSYIAHAKKVKDMNKASESKKIADAKNMKKTVERKRSVSQVQKVNIPGIPRMENGIWVKDKLITNEQLVMIVELHSKGATEEKTSEEVGVSVIRIRYIFTKLNKDNLKELMKKCPSCKEEIKQEANKCRYCGELQDTEEVREMSEQRGRSVFWSVFWISMLEWASGPIIFFTVVYFAFFF